MIEHRSGHRFLGVESLFILHVVDDRRVIDEFEFANDQSQLLLHAGLDLHLLLRTACKRIRFAGNSCEVRIKAFRQSVCFGQSRHISRFFTLWNLDAATFDDMPLQVRLAKGGDHVRHFGVRNRFAVEEKRIWSRQLALKR